MVRTLVIANPYSGNSRKRLSFEEAAGLLRKMDHEVTVHLTTGPGDAVVQARRGADRFDLVVALGGDGTVHEVATGLSGTGCPMAVLPSGSGNDFAVGIGCPTLDAGLEAIANGQDRNLDVCALRSKAKIRPLRIIGVPWKKARANVSSKSLG